jgi:serine/threonine-protein kinase
MEPEQPRREQDTVARNVGRYVLFREVAHGGMATVHLGRLRGIGGFARTVAIKRLHPPFARDPEFVSMFFDEARLAARIQHPNVVSVLDIVASGGELFLVMDYVHGEGLSKLLKRARASAIPTPPNIVVSIVIDVLYGLHAAHGALSERGDPLHIVHRDVSPQNVMVGVDGVARVLDFGIAKAVQRAHSSTRTGQIKGKLRYMAPEQIATGAVDLRADIYAVAAVLWEALTGDRLFPGLETGQLIAQILTRVHSPPSLWNSSLPPELDAIVLRGLERKPEDRYASAHEMAADLERAVPRASPREVGDWVQRIADKALKARAASIAEIELATLADFDSVRAQALSSPGIGQFADPSPDDDAPAERDNRVQTVDVSAAQEEVSVSPDSAFHLPRRALLTMRGRWIAAGGAAAMAVALALVAVVHVQHAAHATPEALAASSDARLAASKRQSAVPVATATGATMAAVAVPPPPSAATATAATTPAPVTGEAVPESPPPPPPATPTASPPAPVRANAARTAGPRGNCTPPYVVDANGVRIPKRWCW